MWTVHFCYYYRSMTGTKNDFELWLEWEQSSRLNKGRPKRSSAPNARPFCWTLLSFYWVRPSQLVWVYKLQWIPDWIPSSLTYNYPAPGISVTIRMKIKRFSIFNFTPKLFANTGSAVLHSTSSHMRLVRTIEVKVHKLTLVVGFATNFNVNHTTCEH
jgi:hypothetical protein